MNHQSRGPVSDFAAQALSPRDVNVRGWSPLNDGLRHRRRARGAGRRRCFLAELVPQPGFDLLPESVPGQMWSFTGERVRQGLELCFELFDALGPTLRVGDGRHLNGLQRSHAVRPGLKLSDVRGVRSHRRRKHRDFSKRRLNKLRLVREVTKQLLELGMFKAGHVVSRDPVHTYGDIGVAAAGQHDEPRPLLEFPPTRLLDAPDCVRLRPDSLVRRGVTVSDPGVPPSRRRDDEHEIRGSDSGRPPAGPVLVCVEDVGIGVDGPNGAQRVYEPMDLVEAFGC